MSEYTKKDLEKAIQEVNELEQRLEEAMARLRVIRYHVTGVLI